jgi:hypothetical protein
MIFKALPQLGQCSTSISRGYMNHSALLALALLALALTGCATSSATSEGESNFQWVGRPYYGNQEPQ